MTDVEYAYVDPVLYICLVHLGLLIVPSNATEYNATGLREDHKESIRLYHENNNDKKALL